jgi:hypothetical protein
VSVRLAVADLGPLREGIEREVREIAGEGASVEIGWLEGSPDADEVLVQIGLPDPGEDAIWDQGITDRIRTAVRTTTARVLPSVVATTRLVSLGADG